MRASTASAHAELEAAPINRRLFADDFSTLELGELLQRFVTVYRTLEAALMYTEQAQALNYTPRMPKLLSGLAVLGCELPSHDLPAPKLADAPSRIGAFYVIEGSSMGGQLIYRHLISRYPSEVLGFFLPHGNNTAERWQSFLEYLEGSLARREMLDKAKAGANDTFQMFHRALTL
ncbi:MAG: biliverdin-producing heme oxygenase [Alphaproteobacteria bacterium]|nr:biliverdin-producing heme oxygenase [Alphaproteobacteria bacterium]